MTKSDFRIVQYKPSNEACSKKTMDDMERERQRKIHDQEVAKAIFNSDKSPLDFMIKSNVSFRYTSKVCERCGKKFRFYRKEHSVFDSTEEDFYSWKQVCIDCINMETDAF